MQSTDGLRVGDRYSMTARTGDRFAGVVNVLAGPIHFAATAENWRKALLDEEFR